MQDSGLILPYIFSLSSPGYIQLDDTHEMRLIHTRPRQYKTFVVIGMHAQ